LQPIWGANDKDQSFHLYEHELRKWANNANNQRNKFAPFAKPVSIRVQLVQNYLMNTVTSFPPIIGDHPRVLILGSMPGIRSLELNQYYGHPRNLFWPFMDEICGATPELGYVQRVETIQQAGIALWDVLQHCARAGSLDADIIASSEIPNDIPGLLREHPTIRAVAFNGGKAEQAFRKHIRPQLSANQLEALAWLPLPSTSPANASISKAEKLKRWMEIKKFL
jgi:hypoxanthine-DNA glycosylase